MLARQQDGIGKNIIKKMIINLREDVKSKTANMEIRHGKEMYNDIVCDLILHGESIINPDVASSISHCMKDNEYSSTIKEMLYEELYYSWKCLHDQTIPSLHFSKLAPEILAWGYEAKTTKKKNISLDFDLSEFSLKNLSALWEAIKFSEIESIDRMRGFVKQKPDAWKISCLGIKNSHLRSIELATPDDMSNISVSRLELFWDSINSANIENLDLSFFDIPLRSEFNALWNVMCNGIKLSKLKHLGVKNMSLYNLNQEQWHTFYQALSQIKLASINLTDNDLYRFSTFGEYDRLREDQLNSFDTICSILRIPSLKHLKLSEDHFERLTAESWLAVCSIIKNSYLESLEISLKGDNKNKFSQEAWMAFINSLKGTKLKSLFIYYSSNELTQPVLKNFCEMLEASQLESVVIRHRYNTLSLQIDDWRKLASAFKKRGIKKFNFGEFDTSEDNLSGLFEAARIADIEMLHIQPRCLRKLSPELWITLANLIKNTKIRTLNIEDDDCAIFLDLAFWRSFCCMIASSGIKTLHININDYYNLTDVHMAALCEMIRSSRLEGLVLNFNKALSVMNFNLFKQFFEAINRSNINYLPCLLSESNLLGTERTDIILNTLHIVENRAKCKNTLFGLCAATLFNRYNAQLTDEDHRIAYSSKLPGGEDQEWDLDLLSGESEILQRFG